MIMKILSTILLTLLIVLGACTSPQVSPDPFVRVSNGRSTVRKTLLYIELIFGMELFWGHRDREVTGRDYFVNWII